MKTIMFSPRTGATRCFTSFNLAQEWFGNTEFIWKPEQFATLRDYKRNVIPLEHSYEALFNWALSRDSFVVLDENTYILRATKRAVVTPRSFYNLDSPEQYIFDLAWDVGDHVRTPPYATYNSQSSHAQLNVGFVVDLAAVAQTLDLLDTKQVKMPKQAAAIIRRLGEERHDFYSKEEMQRFMSSVKTLQAINTKQDPWRIFRYYRQVLISNKVLVDNSGEDK